MNKLKCLNESCPSNDINDESYRHVSSYAVVQWDENISYDFDIDVETGKIGNNLDAEYGEGGNDDEAIKGKELPYIISIKCRICGEYEYAYLDEQYVDLPYTIEQLNQKYLRK